MQQRFFKTLSLLLAFIVFSATTAPADVVDTTAKGRKLIMHLDVKLERKERAKLKKFQKSTKFYGALAIDLTSRGQNGFGFTTGYHSLKTAKEHALKYCQQYATHSDANCALLASIVPATGKKGAKSIPLSRNSLDAYQYMLDKKEDLPGEWAAFAASNFFTDAWAIRPTQKQAKADVLALCKSYVLKNSVENGSKWRAAGINPASEKCKVVSVIKP